MRASNGIILIVAVILGGIAAFWRVIGWSVTPNPLARPRLSWRPRLLPMARNSQPKT